MIAAEQGADCIIVDPGDGAADRLEAVLTEHDLKPAAVLLTHGHLDHVYSVTPVCGAHNIPAMIHSDDRYRLQDPTSSMPPDVLAMFSGRFGKASSWSEPTDVRELSGQTTLDIAELKITVTHAPGHTEGSAMFTIDGAPTGLRVSSGQTEFVPSATIFSGDVLFAGSIGRTDLPGGSGAQMEQSLREQIWPLADDLLVLPGHGPGTTIGQERAHNPWLRQAGGAA